MLLTNQRLFERKPVQHILILAIYELNVFETRQQSENVHLSFDDMVLTTMLRGKKIMHLFGQQQFDYLPGESVIVPDHEEMVIGFPESR